MKQPLNSQRLTVRLDPNIIDNMAQLMQEHPFKYQSHNDLVRQALDEYMALRVDSPGESLTPVKMPQKIRARLQRMIENGYGNASQIITAALRHYSQFLLEEEALFMERFEKVESSSPRKPKIPQGLVQE